MTPAARDRGEGSLRRIFRAPLLLGLLSAIGLVSALLGDDFWDALSWLTLGAPLPVIAWSIARPVRS